MEYDLINKYLENKRKTLLSYASSLYKVTEFDNNELWSNEIEFNKVFSEILDIYFAKYFFTDPIKLKKLNVNNLKDKEFKMTLSLAVLVDYFGEDYQKYTEIYKRNVLNLTTILYVVTNVDKTISFYNNGNVTNKEIIKKMNHLFNDITNDVNIAKNPFFLEMLANKIKEFEKKEIRFFESLKDSESYINFIKYDENIYYVDYVYEIRNLLNYPEVSVSNVYNKYNFKDEYLSLRYELLVISILKLYVNNCSIPKYMLPISSKYLSKASGKNLINSLFEKNSFKDNIIFSAYYSDFIKNEELFNSLIDLNYKLVLYLDQSESIMNYQSINEDFDYYITKEFTEKNPQFISYCDEKTINYKYVNDEVFSEDEIISMNMEKE